MIIIVVGIVAMGTASMAEAKAHLSELIARAEAGEEITLTRHGKPLARIVPGLQPQARKPIDVAAMQAFAESMPLQEESAGDFIRRMRSDARY